MCTLGVKAITFLKCLWAGMTIGTIFEGVIYLITCQHINWEKQVQLAIERTEQLILDDDQLQEGSTNQSTGGVQHSTNIKSSSIKDECVNDEEQVDVQNDNSFRESVTEAGASLVDDYNPPANEFRSNSQKILSIQLEKVIVSRTIFILFMLFLLSLAIIMRVLKPWSKKFGAYCTFSNGTFISLKDRNIFLRNSTETILDADNILLKYYDLNCTISIP
ncbi:unnamed protein product [Schistosoma mattheei]|uniref:Uncharacterized protein n=1 Tax=Schistosoma mattheei TaxID=31246 RepID=A0A183PT28_9TREM|nr:unnamed protein product [Schistosoma mattheei]